MIPITSIQAGQKWAFAKIKRGDIEISHVNLQSNRIFWSYVDHSSNVFDSTYDQFIQDFIPRDDSLNNPEPQPGPNDDRDFLL